MAALGDARVLKKRGGDSTGQGSMGTPLPVPSPPPPTISPSPRPGYAPVHTGGATTTSPARRASVKGPRRTSLSGISKLGGSTAGPAVGSLEEVYLIPVEKGSSSGERTAPAREFVKCWWQTANTVLANPHHLREAGDIVLIAAPSSVLASPLVRDSMCSCHTLRSSIETPRCCCCRPRGMAT